MVFLIVDYLDESWSYNFTNKVGVFTYFCTIHPLMTVVVDVKETQRIQQKKGQIKTKLIQYQTIQ